MVGGYVIFRCIDVLCRASNTFSSNTGRVVMQVFAALGIAANLIMIAALFSSAESTSTGLR